MSTFSSQYARELLEPERQQEWEKPVLPVLPSSEVVSVQVVKGDLQPSPEPSPRPIPTNSGENENKKFIFSDITENIHDISTTEKETNARPSSPCPAGHPLPYGQTWWLDAYGSWHCLDCSPPICDAQVKEHIFMGGSGSNKNHTFSGDGHQQPTQDDFSLTTGFEILAIQSPAGVWAFAPETTQAKRRDAVDNVDWFDRMDASDLRQAEKNQK